ncbi:hypothetical protein [Streptomyces zagrosensis]|uniref:Uncharacterized protein n=1 Tax=Streptomyces zagrosensis TaxID=1042984 RepID=A0A7W9Q7H4_9ACTN|nr:hypothetical protein [Streptomyces zagrosensis]MBB5934137.1 hypothetical protein [Streptomyces zagrosensis]
MLEPDPGDGYIAAPAMSHGPPGPVFDHAVLLAEVPDGHRAMDHRSALRVYVTF